MTVVYAIEPLLIPWPSYLNELEAIILLTYLLKCLKNSSLYKKTVTAAEAFLSDFSEEVLYKYCHTA